MDSEDDMRDSVETESIDDFYSGETAMMSEDDEGDYGFFDNNSDGSDAITIHRTLQTYTILNEADIHQRQEDDITRVSTVLSISRDSASLLLRHYNWSVFKVNDEWFADENKIWKAVGLLEKPILEIVPNTVELTCGICFDTYPHGVMHAAVCGHQFCTACWKEKQSALSPELKVIS